jgi:hypothetical protein
LPAEPKRGGAGQRGVCKGRYPERSERLSRSAFTALAIALSLSFLSGFSRACQHECAISIAHNTGRRECVAARGEKGANHTSRSVRIQKYSVLLVKSEIQI